jgi:hypothetical protein
VNDVRNSDRRLFIHVRRARYAPTVGEHADECKKSKPDDLPRVMVLYVVVFCSQSRPPIEWRVNICSRCVQFFFAFPENERPRFPARPNNER